MDTYSAILSQHAGVHIQTHSSSPYTRAELSVRRRGRGASDNYLSIPPDTSIRESVDSLCRDGADVQQKPYNFTTSMLKAYLSA